MRLDLYMAEQGLTDDAMAERIGVSRVSVTRWRNGTRSPSWDSVKRIVDVTRGKVSADDFLELSTAR